VTREDGFKPGTNYNRPMRPQVEPQAELRLGLALAAECGEGRHNEAVAEPGRVTYAAYGRRVEPGTWYCRRCGRILDPPSAGQESEAR
jgi:hypothetical protein